MNSLILKTGTRLLSGLMLVFALFMLYRGHNEPGGGFIGGLIAVTAFAMLAIAYGPGMVRRVIGVVPGTLAMAGVAVAIVAGGLAWLTGQPFLTGLWTFPGATPDDPKGPFPLGTPLLFDIGVFMVVVGAVLAILLALEEPEPDPDAADDDAGEGC